MKTPAVKKQLNDGSDINTGYSELGSGIVLAPLHSLIKLTLWGGIALHLLALALSRPLSDTGDATLGRTLYCFLGCFHFVVGY